METVHILVRDAKFWTAVLFLVETVLFFAVPAFPKEIWAAVSALLGIVFAALTTRTTVQARRLQK